MTERLTGNGPKAPPSPTAGHSRAENLDWVWEQSGTAYTLRLNRRRWEDIEIDTFGRPLLIVLGTWFLLAWARFGSHAISSPRALVRYVLVGVYAWLGLSLIMWFVARLQIAGRSSESGAPPFPSPSPSALDSLSAMAIKVGQAHQPLGIGALVIQIIQILPTGPVTGIIAISSVIWMGGQLVGVMAAYQQRPAASVAVATLASWLPWLATAGLYLWQRLGHLI